MTDHKPLPALPLPTALSVDAARHRSALLRHFLSAVYDPGIEQRLDGWAVVLGDVLDEMSQCIVRDDWLKAFRRSRQERMQERRQKETSAHELRLAAAKGKGTMNSTTKHSESSHDGKHVEFQTVPTGKQLLLCVAPLGNFVHPAAEDSKSNTVPAHIGCSFLPGTYLIQESGFSTILYGNKDAAATSGEGSASQVVGGTFRFKGIASPAQHKHLFDVLRISVYVHLSLILSQHFFLDSHVPMTFPRPTLSSPSPSVPGRPSVDDIASSRKKRISFIPSGVFSFLSKTGISRFSTISPVLGSYSSVKPLSEQDPSTPRSSLDVGINRLRRISFLGETRSQKKAETPTEEQATPFVTVLKQIENQRGLLSSSVDVSFPPPKLLVEIARAEEQCRPQSYRLKGEQKTGLGSVLGWNGKEGLARQMIGIPGFLRHQGLSVLVVRHIPSEYTSVPEVEAVLTDSGTTSSLSSSASSIQIAKPSAFTMCGRPGWRIFRYYSKDLEEDLGLGEAIWEFVWSASMLCEQPGCRLKRGQHETRLLHGGVKIIINVEVNSEREEGEVSRSMDEQIELWESCKICEAKSKREQMTDGTFLISFGKFVELLVYSPVLATLKPPLCEHTIPPPLPWPFPPISRFNIVRHFSTKTHTVRFTCSTLDDIFEIRVPRLQIIRSGEDRSSRDAPTSFSDSEEEKRSLRREIKKWWETVANHMDKLESLLAFDEERMELKALPRLPSADEEYEQSDASRLSILSQEDSIQGLPVPPGTLLRLPSEATNYFENHSPAPPPISLKASLPKTPAEWLTSLRQTFQRTEQSLYAQLGRTPVSSLNDVRRSFIASAKGAEKRLGAWQKKHMSPVAASQVPEKPEVEQPEWWEKKCHTVPSSNMLVREDDLGSIIAYTLSSPDYHHELGNMTFSRLASMSSSLLTASEEPSTPSAHSSSSFFSAAMGYRLFMHSNPAQPDPDVDDVAWSEPEPFSSVVSRTAHPRDTANIIKEVLRQNSKPYTEGADTQGSSRPSSAPSFPLRLSTLGSATPLSAWAKPDIQVSKDETVVKAMLDTTFDAVEEVGKILEHEVGGGEKGESFFVSQPESHASGTIAWSSTLGKSDTQSIHGEAPSISAATSSSASSFVSATSDVTIGKDSTGTAKFSSSGPPPLPPKDDQSVSNLRQAVGAHAELHPVAPHSPLIAVPVPKRPTSSSGSITSTLTSGFGSIMKFMLRDTDQNRASLSPTPKHALPSAEAMGIDDRPHIKHDWTVGKRRKVSCTVYYAKQFEMLRKRCGIDDVYIKSLACSTNWSAAGGKSRSAFRKTVDDRFIIKTLVDAWNVADLQVLLEIAPSYLRYIETTANRAAVLAKVLGFYTVEIRNLETGVVQSKADLLVMENLFYQQKILQAFDLKGIQGRKVKPASGSKVSPHSDRPQTLFDGEWIEGQQKALMLVFAHAKHILRSALRNDADFLVKSNIMDYSLLVGVNDEKKEIACGLVDTIGSYTFAKTLEYKAKHGLNSGKDITVMPPKDYEERFINALEGYFVACPDKWTRPPDESRITTDINHLPSVL